jgi:hypothetical protein
VRERDRERERECVCVYVCEIESTLKNIALEPGKRSAIQRFGEGVWELSYL